MKHRERIVENLPDVFFRLGTDLRYQYLSPSAEQITGRKPEQFFGKTVVEAGLPTSVWSQIEARCREITRTGRPQTFEFDLNTPTGPRFFESQVIPQFDAFGVVESLLGVIHDLTVRKQAEQALQRERSFLRKVIDATPSLIFVKDSEGHFILANEALAHAYSTSVERITGKTDAEFNTDSEEVARFQHDDREVMNSRKEKLFPDEKVTFADGQVHWFMTVKVPVMDEDGTCDKVLGVATDITERRLAERALRESEERFRVTFEQAAVGIAHVGFDGRWLRFNEKLCEITGHSREQLLALTFQDITHPDDLEANLTQVRRLLSGEIPHYSIEKRYLRPDGTPVWIHVTGSLLHNADPQPPYFIAVVEDISDRKRLEQALQQRAEQLAESDRRKDEFLAMLGHELRNPLAGIVNGIEVMKMLGSLGQEVEEMRDVIERQASHMTHLIDDLLDVSRISKGKIQLRKKRVDLVELVARTAESYRRSIEHNGLALVVDVPHEPLWGSADPIRLSQVVGNVLNNATKFTNAGGQITVTLAATPDCTAARISVKDTGIGMEDHVLRRVFEPFSQAESSLHRTRGGLGLGLALVKGLVEMHGGEVAACSAGLGNGSEFSIRLPLSGEGAEAPSTASRPALRIKSYRVLLIDDRRDAILPLRKMLALFGQQVETAEDGASGLKKARAFQPEIVLCDIGLPDLNGYDVAHTMRADPALRSAYLVAVTGYGQDEDRRRAVQSGFDFHITKPVSKAQLETLLTRFPHFELSLSAGDSST